MAVETLLKQPGEVLRRPVGFPGLVVAAIVSAGAVARLALPGGAPLAVSAELANGVVTVELQGGVIGESYLVTVQAESADGETGEAELDVSVMDLEWAMPDGGAAYLSIADFVARFGLPEVIRMTDGAGDGRIDRDMLVAELVNAQAVVDGYVGARYTVPLSEAPLLVRKWVGDLARAALYPGGAPEGVADQAKAAIKMLERVQSGAMPLQLAVSAPEAPSDNPVLIAPGNRIYPDGLAGYGSGRW